MHEKTSKSRRRYQRIQTPKGVWVAWQTKEQKQSVSRVSDLNLGGLFIVTPNPAALGTEITVLLSVPEGEIRGRSTVRNATPEGMGVEFTEIAKADRARLQALITRLLASTPNASSAP
ncbi:MAG TPA: PilZ domain-containing protein [Candidatus Acidoferrales bacterium]|jgi:Tfp pilus assembly protein PilZ|nr:PilZ domain-containing protein [Candidatus Acidoferrales bacterium]